MRCTLCAGSRRERDAGASPVRGRRVTAGGLPHVSGHRGPRQIHQLLSHLYGNGRVVSRDDRRSPESRKPNLAFVIKKIMLVLLFNDRFSLACSHKTRFLLQGFGDFRTLELLLMCMGHHQYEVQTSSVCFGFLVSFHLTCYLLMYVYTCVYQYSGVDSLTNLNLMCRWLTSHSTSGIVSRSCCIRKRRRSLRPCSSRLSLGSSWRCAGTASTSPIWWVKSTRIYG